MTQEQKIINFYLSAKEIEELNDIKKLLKNMHSIMYHNVKGGGRLYLNEIYHYTIKDMEEYIRMLDLLSNNEIKIY